MMMSTMVTKVRVKVMIARYHERGILVKVGSSLSLLASYRWVIKTNELEALGRFRDCVVKFIFNIKIKGRDRIPDRTQ